MMQPSLKMTAQVVETSVTVNNNSPLQQYVHPDDQTQPTFELTPGFKPFTLKKILAIPFSMTFIILRNREETLKTSSLPSKQRLVS